MSSLVTVYQGNTLNLNLYFSDATNGSPLNLSGYQVYYTAAQSYADTGNQLFNIGVTGDASNTGGNIIIPLSSQDTNYCPGVYQAQVTVSGAGQKTTYNTDGLSIMPALLII